MRVGLGARGSWLVGIATVAIGLAGGCEGGGELGAPCADGCRAGLSCGFGRCREPCSHDEDCAPGRCVAESPEGPLVCTIAGRDQTCSAGFDCPAPLLCVEGECRNGCTGDADCPGEAICEQGASAARACVFDPRPSRDAGVDGGGAFDAALDYQPLDAAAPGADAMPDPWLPDTCLDAAGGPVGRGCEQDADCAPGQVCDEAESITIPIAGEPDPWSLDLFPGGTCVAAARGPIGPLEPSSECGPCQVRLDFNGMKACRDRCEPGSADPRTRCRDGYVCHPHLAVCVERCHADTECRAFDPGPELHLAPEGTRRCDLETGACAGGGSGALGDACAGQADCAPGLSCPAGSEPSWLRPPWVGFGRLPTTLPPSEAAFCTTSCDPTVPDACGAGAVCGRSRLSFVEAHERAFCLPACEVGAEPAEDRLGVDGHGQGCRTGFRCAPLLEGGGGCVPGFYNAVAEPNLGVACDWSLQQCWSPYGAGLCLSYLGRPFCAVIDCDALPADACGPSGACVGDLCVSRCDSAEECPAGWACSLSPDLGVRACSVTCHSDDDCARGRCVDGGCAQGLGAAPCGGPDASSLGVIGEDGWRRLDLEGAEPLPPDPELACNPQQLPTWASFTYRPPEDGVLEVVVEDGLLQPAVTIVGCGGVTNEPPAPGPGACLLPGAPARLASGGTYSVLIRAPTQDVPETFRVALRFTPRRPLGATCSRPEADECASGLACQAHAGGFACLPDGACGIIPTFDLLEEARLEWMTETPRWTLDYDTLGTRDTFDASCVAIGIGSDETPGVALRYTNGSRPLRFRAHSMNATLSLRSDCGDPASELDCARGPAGVEQVLAPEQTVTLMVESAVPGPELSPIHVYLEPVVGLDEPCSGAACEEGTFCQGLSCTDQDLGCGPGVQVHPIGGVPPGGYDLEVDHRFTDFVEPCAAAARDVATIYRFHPMTPAEIHVDFPETAHSLRTTCADPRSALACGTFGPFGPQVVEPGTDLFLLIGPPPHEGPLEERGTGIVIGTLFIEEVGLEGYGCGPGLPRCAHMLTCFDGRCAPTRCGDGALGPGEECDDRNLTDGDGCSSSCRVEPQRPGGDSCAAPQEVAWDVRATGRLWARLAAEGRGATDAETPDPSSCIGSPTEGAPDRVFRIPIPQPGLLEAIVTDGAGFGYMYAGACEPAAQLLCGRMDGMAVPRQTVQAGDFYLVLEPDPGWEIGVELYFTPSS